jgi:hypothetical protein
MKITVTQDQALTIQNVLITNIANKELNGVNTTQERETLNRVGIALLLEELHREELERVNKLTAAN